MREIRIQNPLFGEWKIYSNIPEYEFNQMWCNWADSVIEDKVCVYSFCLYLIDHGYSALTDEVINFLK